MGQKTIGFIGAGKMAEALIGGILAAKVVSKGDITVSDVSAARIKYMKGKYKVAGAESNAKLCADCDVIVLSVKPNQIEKVLFDIRDSLDGNKLIISIAAGVKVETILKNLSWDIKPQILRVMPNTPAQVLEGASGLYFNENCSDENIDFAKKVFDAVGMSIIIDKEKMLDSVTALSGSGPAYVFFFIEALSDAGVSMGLSREISRELAVQTVFGAAKMAKETGEHPTILKDMVTSPGGTTIEALKTLEVAGVKGSIIEAVNKAYKKSKKLSKKD